MQFMPAVRVTWRASVTHRTKTKGDSIWKAPFSPHGTMPAETALRAVAVPAVSSVWCLIMRDWLVIAKILVFILSVYMYIGILSLIHIKLDLYQIHTWFTSRQRYAALCNQCLYAFFIFLAISRHVMLCQACNNSGYPPQPCRNLRQPLFQSAVAVSLHCKKQQTIFINH